MNDWTAALVDALDDYDRVVEIGIGHRTQVAAALADVGVDVTATDVYPRDVPDSVRFVVDDITDSDRALYTAAGAVYALNLPPELHRPAWETARDANADLLFTTLGGDQPTIPVERRTLPRETLFVANRTRN